MTKLSSNEIIYYTNYWCKTKGISSRDLEKHPRIEDVVLLINFREEFWSDMTKSQQGSWAAFWSYSYTHKKSLKPKHLDKLEQILHKIRNNRYWKNFYLAEKRQKIQALRNNTVATQTKSKPAENMTAKDVGLSQTVPWE